MVAEIWPFGTILPNLVFWTYGFGWPYTFRVEKEEDEENLYKNNKVLAPSVLGPLISDAALIKDHIRQLLT